MNPASMPELFPRSRPLRSSKTIAALARGAGLLGAGVAIVSLRYLLPGMPFPAPLPNTTLNRSALIVHAGSAALALLIIPIQLWTSRRLRGGLRHRLAGVVAAIAIYIAAGAALQLAPAARGGAVASLGFASLAVAWILTATIGLDSARQRNYAAHRRWMIRTAALTFAAVTLRVYMPLTMLLGVQYDDAYRAVAWLCWIPNLLVAETWLRRGAVGELANL